MRYDKPETHVIKKDGIMYYAFYSKNWNGDIELRGLEKDKSYVAFDYINEVEVSNFNGNNPTINIAFEDYLLIEVTAK